jgi:leukotriene-A4 hydrolase
MQPGVSKINLWLCSEGLTNTLLLSNVKNLLFPAPRHVPYRLDHFWLNEGWTTWFQRKIMAKIKNNPKFLDFDAIDGRKHLQDSMNEMIPKDTCLVLDIGDSDPDDSYSSVAYEKGFTFLLYLERLVGSKEFEVFFKAYIARFASNILTSNDFKDFYLTHFKGNDKVGGIDWDSWFYGEGMPPVLPELDQTMAIASQNLADLWVGVDRDGKASPAKNVMQSWSSLQITCFLDDLAVKIGDKPLQVSTLDKMNKLYKFGESKNSEVLSRYCQLAIPSEDESVIPVTIRFITTQGRLKFVRPLYRALYKSKMGKELAVETFLNHLDFYHPIGVKMIAIDLNVEKQRSSSTSSTSKWIVPGVVIGAATIVVALFRRRK